MNIMLVSVTERIREIGLRKALGAPPRLIRRQFLRRGIVLGLAGGVLGVARRHRRRRSCCPRFIDHPVDRLARRPSSAAIAVAVGIGVVFGVYPATRAARLAPIDALRSE